MPISGNPTIFGVDPYHAGSNSDTETRAILGTLAVDPDGRTHRYGQLAGTAVGTSRLCVKAAITANHEDIAFQTAGVVGDSSASISVGATDIVANEYDDGFLVIIDDAGEGYVHRITRHGVNSGAATVVFGITPNLQVATTTATTVTLVRNEWRDLVIATGGTQTDIPAGITVVAMAADEFGFFGVAGVFPCLTSGTNTATAGEPVTIGEATNGSLSGRDAVAEPLVGYAPTGVAPTSGENNPYYVSIV